MKSSEEARRSVQAMPGADEAAVMARRVGASRDDPRRVTDRDYADAYFETRFGYDRRREIVWDEVVRYLQDRWIPPESRIVDLGAGYCNFINTVEGREKHAVDLFSEIPELAGPDVQAHVRSCASMDFLPTDHIDVAFASNLLEHLERSDLRDVMNEIRRVVRPGGTLIVLQPNFRFCYNTYFDDYTHLQIFTDRSLVDFLAVYGFVARHVQPRFLPVNMKSTLRLRLPLLRQLVKVYLRLPYRPLAGQMLLVCESEKPAAVAAGGAG